jgi:SAM-dependent methyltransferase
MKLHLGCGNNKIVGWENHDIDVDITEPLPFLNDSADFIFTEHVVEHLTPTEAWNFFNESFRVLKRGGVLRTTVPDITKLWRLREDPDKVFEYIEFGIKHGWTTGTFNETIRSIVLDNGHKSLWTAPLLVVSMLSIGFSIAYEQYVHISESSYPELQGLERMGVFRRENSIVVEAVK